MLNVDYCDQPKAEIALVGDRRELRDLSTRLIDICVSQRDWLELPVEASQSAPPGRIALRSVRVERRSGPLLVWVADGLQLRIEGDSPALWSLVELLRFAPPSEDQPERRWPATESPPPTARGSLTLVVACRPDSD